MTYKKTKITCTLAFLLSAVLQLIMLHKSFSNLSQILILTILLGAMIIVAMMFYIEYKQYQASRLTAELTITYLDISLLIGIVLFFLGKYLPLSRGICTIFFIASIIVFIMTLIFYIKLAGKEKL